MGMVFARGCEECGAVYCPSVAKKYTGKCRCGGRIVTLASDGAVNPEMPATLVCTALQMAIVQPTVVTR